MGVSVISFDPSVIRIGVSVIGFAMFQTISYVCHSPLKIIFHILCVYMRTFLALLLFALIAAPLLGQTKKARITKQPLSLPACGEAAPYVKVGGGEIFLNGRPVQLMSVGVWQRGGLRFVRYEVSPSDTTFALSPVSMPGLILALAFKADQTPAKLTTAYYETGSHVGMVEPHGYLRYAGEGSVLRFELVKNEGCY